MCCVSASLFFCWVSFFCGVVGLLFVGGYGGTLVPHLVFSLSFPTHPPTYLPTPSSFSFLLAAVNPPLSAIVLSSFCLRSVCVIPPHPFLFLFPFLPS